MFQNLKKDWGIKGLTITTVENDYVKGIHNSKCLHGTLNYVNDTQSV